jgi:hypothetical protein
MEPIKENPECRGRDIGSSNLTSKEIWFTGSQSIGARCGLIGGKFRRVRDGHAPRGRDQGVRVEQHSRNAANTTVLHTPKRCLELVCLLPTRVSRKYRRVERKLPPPPNLSAGRLGKRLSQ